MFAVCWGEEGSLSGLSGVEGRVARTLAPSVLVALLLPFREALSV